MIPITTALLAFLWHALRSEVQCKARRLERDRLTRLQTRRAGFCAYRWINTPIDWRD